MILRSDPSWHTARLGKLTASRMADAMSLTKKMDSTELRHNYMRDIVAERLTDIIVAHPVTLAMQWGIDMQSAAIDEYERATGNIVGPEAFFIHPEPLAEFGATPDGLIEESTVLEVKCPTTRTHIQYLESQEIPHKYQYQMAAQILCTQRSDGVFVSFDPRVRSNKRLLILEFKPEKSLLDEVYVAAEFFLQEVDKLFERVTTS